MEYLQMRILLISLDLLLFHSMILINLLALYKNHILMKMQDLNILNDLIDQDSLNNRSLIKAIVSLNKVITQILEKINNNH
jgi:hypothetical protein